MTSLYILRKLGLIPFVAMFCASNLFAQSEVRPAAPPAPAEAVPAPIAQVVVTRNLANGITVKTQSIPGIHEAVVLVQLGFGDDYDPADGAGLSQLVIDVAATGAVDNVESNLLTVEDLDKKYPRGWVARSHPRHAILGYVVSTDDLGAQMKETANRIGHVQFRAEAVNGALARMRDDIDRRFRREVQLTPMSWVAAKAFRHVSHPHYGVSPDKLAKMSVERLQGEWLKRVDPRVMTVFLVGNLGEDAGAVDEMIDGSFGAIEERVGAVEELPVTVTAETGKDRRRRILVDRLPGDKEGIVVAFYAPALTDADHPAFLAVAYDFMKTARKMPGAQARIPFQYSMLLDSRAAYLTPHIWRFPKGAGQALGFWTVKILNRKFSNTDGAYALHRLGWQLGGPIPSGFISAINERPALLYTIAYGTTVRENTGDSEFWESYRNTLKGLKKDDLAAARDEYFTDENEAIFVLTPKER